MAKISQVGIDTLADSEGPANILRAGRKNAIFGVFHNDVLRGWQDGIGFSHQIAAAEAAGDTVKAAAITAKFNAELPGIAPLLC